jgi:hypothetical protein
MSRVKRPFTAMTVLGTAAHHGFELNAGVGLVFQPYLGLGGSIAYWGANLPFLFWAAARGGERFDKPLAFGSGSALGGMLVHFTIWPWKTRAGLPLLTEAEGLSPEQLPAYNAILWAWALAAVLACWRETPKGARRWFVLGVVNALPLRASAKHHFVWASEQARTNPAWWNRGLQ